MTPTEETAAAVLQQRMELLAAERRLIAAMSPEKAMARILNARQPAALVHSYPEQDLHLLIRRIGPDDALPILALASNRQWEYCLDVEVWEKDRIDIHRTTQWLSRLLRSDASPARIAWLLKEKVETLELYLGNTTRFVVREEEQDPSEFADGFDTLDGTFFFRVNDNGLESPMADHEGCGIEEEEDEDNPTPLPHALLRRIAAHDYDMFVRLLLQSASVIPDEAEEEAYRWRNVRLQEKGIPPFEEAVGIYQPISVKTLKPLPRDFRRPPRERTLPIPATPLFWVSGAGLFQQALKGIDSAAVRDRMQLEFAALANRLVVADRMRIQDPEDLKSAVQKACGYLSIGLEMLLEKSRHSSLEAAGRLLKRYPVTGIFQVGWTAVVALKSRAQKWYRNSWSRQEGFPLSFWGEAWMGALGGLFLKRPLYFDHYRRGAAYREFETRSEVDEIAQILEQMAAVDHLLSRIPITVGVVRRQVPVTYKNMLLTLWARDVLGLPRQLAGIPADRFRNFMEKLFPGDPEKKVLVETPAVCRQMTDAFRLWVADRSELPDATLSAAALSKVFESLFAEMADQLGAVSPEAADARFIDLFLVAS